MNTRRRVRAYLSAAALIAVMVVADGLLGNYVIPAGSIVSEAQAVVGRPLTPGSYAGVARRTTRRTIRRSTIYVSTLPAGCVVTSVNGVRVWQCSGTYYQAYGGRYVVVYID